MRLVNVCSTAVCRPEIVEQCYSSFIKNVTDIDLSQCPFFLNVDPIPDPSKAIDVVRVARKYFKKIIEVRLSDKPNFVLAAKWVWGRALKRGLKYTLNLEDDWRLKVPIKLEDWIRELEQKPNLLELSFHYCKVLHNCYLDPAPAVFKTHIFKKVIPLMDPSKGLVGTLKEISQKLKIDKPGTFAAKRVNGKSPLEDLGRPWMRRNKLPILNKYKPTWDIYL